MLKSLLEGRPARLRSILLQCFVASALLAAQSGLSMAQPAAGLAQQTPAIKSSSNPDSRTESLMAVFQQGRASYDKLKGKFDSADVDDAFLADLKVQVDDLHAQLSKSSSEITERLAQIEGRITALGEPPAAGQPPESAVVTEERKGLLAERAELNALTGEASAVTKAVSDLSNAITEKRRRMFGEALLRHTDMSPGIFVDAGGALVTEFATLKDRIASWLSFAWKAKRLSLLAALALSGAAAFLFLAGGYRLFGRMITRNPALDNPPYITRLSFAFWSLMVQSLSLAAFLMATYVFLASFNVLRPDIAPIISSFFGLVWVVFFIARLSYLVFAPKHPKWRLVRLTDRGARRLSAFVALMAIINGLDYLLATISEVLNSPLVLTIVKSLTSTVLIGLILILMSFMKPVLGEDRNPAAAGKPWPRGLPLLFRAAGLGLILAVLTGYIGLARFAATQIVLTGAVLVAMYIGILSGKAVGKQGAFGHTAVGRYLSARYKLGEVTQDQIGLGAGLSIYAVALMFGVPVILLTWGFQIQDIQAGAYRLFTQISIGNINISLVGILVGVLLFMLFYLGTRGVQHWIDRNVMARSQVDAGVRNSVKTGIGYLGIGVAAVVGVSAAGFDLSSLALVASALSVGIGFGLQNIVSNFVSGLILLVERPFKVGDHIVTGTTEGIVKRISVRATEIETFRKQSIIVPNSDLINASVGNWTHRNRMQRAEILVGVSYDSDPQKVIAVLMDIASSQPNVLQNPEPHVDFIAFGPSSLDFELRFHMADMGDGIAIRAAVRTAILKRFREEGIEIPYPHQDVKIIGTVTTRPEMPKAKTERATSQTDQPDRVLPEEGAKA
ncbi:mechanosensitive ion channel family protein [Rhizobium sp. FY34]|uniref:mechanosensitive ion channel family protein n=1 Tax=Rhizobium sp. FY34 TaxID=2562309 RepID=UPI001485AB3C|nr:mechanosensitive ion channel family protein [Rhizobium sp. FY34]